LQLVVEVVDNLLLVLPLVVELVECRKDGFLLLLLTLLELVVVQVLLVVQLVLAEF
jgi:hypothetical protein